MLPAHWHRTPIDADSAICTALWPPGGKFRVQIPSHLADQPTVQQFAGLVAKLLHSRGDVGSKRCPK
jgi:hypothetical protein